MKYRGSKEENRANLILKRREEEFKINFDVYNSKRLQQPTLYRGIRKVQRSELSKITVFVGLPKAFSDDKLCITNVTKPYIQTKEYKEEAALKKKIKDTILNEKARGNRDPVEAERQIEELKQLVKEQTKTLKERGGMLPNRPEFPIRF